MKTNQTITDAFGFSSAIHPKKYRLPLCWGSVFLCQAAVQLSGLYHYSQSRQEVTGPLGINMSHKEAQTNDGVVLWRRMEIETISPVFISFSCPHKFISRHANEYETGALRGWDTHRFTSLTCREGHSWISIHQHNASWQHMQGCVRQITSSHYDDKSELSLEGG